VTTRILIVDDEPALRRTLERALRSHHYEVVSVADPHSAYQMLSETTFDLVLLDLRLPQIGGDTLFLAIIRRWPRMQDRVILISGDPWSEQMDWPQELLSCPILAKPFTLEALAKTVSAVLAAADTHTDLLEGNGHG
jgi:two-component system, OmpR family, KDP operon response regulator KdpE